MRRVTVSALVTLLVTGAACNKPDQPAAGGPPQMPPTPVALATASLAPIDDATEYVGTLKSLHSTTVQPQVDGQITQILVKSGDRVAAGMPIAQIDSQRQQAAVSSQEAERNSRAAAVTFARQQAERSRQLLAAGAISRQEAEQAETALRTAEANLQALSAQVQQQQVQLRYFTVTAPTAGIVGDVPVRVGNQVTPQTLLTTIDQNETLEANVSVPIERAADLRVGLPMDIRASDGAQSVASTKVGFISPHVDETTQSILVKSTVANPGGRLRAMQYIRARIVWKTSSGIAIPVTAVLRISGQYFAFVAEDAGGKLVARQRAIKVGPIAGDNYPVLDGLKAGDRIVVSGVQKLADGVPISSLKSEVSSLK